MKKDPGARAVSSRRERLLREAPEGRRVKILRGEGETRRRRSDGGRVLFRTIPFSGLWNARPFTENPLWRARARACGRKSATKTGRRSQKRTTTHQRKNGSAKRMDGRSPLKLRAVEDAARNTPRSAFPFASVRPLDEQGNKEGRVHQPKTNAFN